MEKEHKKKKSSKSKPSETLAGGSGGGARGKIRRRLLRSIAAFLETSGFAKTLVEFQSEAQLESIKSKSPSIDLEDLFCRFLESSSSHDEAAINCQKTTDTHVTEGALKDEIRHVSDVSKQINEKKGKHKKEPTDGNNLEPEHGLDKNSDELNKSGPPDGPVKLKSAEETHGEIKDKKKKKKKDKVSSDDLHESPAPDSKKENIEEIVKDKIAELNSLTNMSSASQAKQISKHKGDKKQKKMEAAVEEVSADGEKHTVETLMKCDKLKETSTGNVDKLEKKAHKKRKRLDYEDRAPEDVDQTKSKESNVKLENAENNKEDEALEMKGKSLSESENATGTKKRKKDIDNEKSDGAGDHNALDSGPQQLANGKPDKRENGGGTLSNSKKKEKRSAEEPEYPDGQVSFKALFDKTKVTGGWVSEECASIDALFIETETRGSQEGGGSLDIATRDRLFLEVSEEKTKKGVNLGAKCAAAEYTSTQGSRGVIGSSRDAVLQQTVEEHSHQLVCLQSGQQLILGALQQLAEHYGIVLDIPQVPTATSAPDPLPAPTHRPTPALVDPTPDGGADHEDADDDEDEESERASDFAVTSPEDELIVEQRQE